MVDCLCQNRIASFPAFWSHGNQGKGKRMRGERRGSHCPSPIYCSFPNFCRDKMWKTPHSIACYVNCRINFPTLLSLVCAGKPMLLSLIINLPQDININYVPSVLLLHRHHFRQLFNYKLFMITLQDVLPYMYNRSYCESQFILYTVGVDLTIWAHEHCKTYERLFPLYNRQVRYRSLFF